VKELIRTGLEQLGLLDLVPADTPEKLERYGLALIEKNKVMNLTAITELKDVATLHMLDCAALLGVADLNGASLIDVGTGAGFPGLVLKTLVPSLNVTLLDSLQKRLDWLEETWTDLGLTQIRAIHGRAEEAGHAPALREQFDFATARAVADLRVLCEMCLPFVKVGGRFLAMKSVDSSQELTASDNAIRALGGTLAGYRDYAIPHTQVTHRVVIIEKISPTPAAFPRRWAKMQKAPL
jgi:16S rRNA (guanine527-N7)-methyltransferase